MLNVGRGQEKLRGERWVDMLTDSEYDSKVDIEAAFRAACDRHPPTSGRLSWRGGGCGEL